MAGNLTPEVAELLDERMRPFLEDKIQAYMSRGLTRELSEQLVAQIQAMIIQGLLEHGVDGVNRIDIKAKADLAFAEAVKKMRNPEPKN